VQIILIKRALKIVAHFLIKSIDNDNSKLIEKELGFVICKPESKSCPRWSGF
jgi:hypothetical protein